MEEHIEKSLKLFKSGYNCCQSVVLAYSDLYGLDQDQAMKISSVFGGGIGRMNLTCGAACGMFILSGLENGSLDPKDAQKKSNNYKVIQQLAKEFTEKNGSLCCGEMLGLVKRYSAEGQELPPLTKRPCSEIVLNANLIFTNYLKTKGTNK